MTGLNVQDVFILLNFYKMKKLQQLTGAKKLSKKEQQSVKGGHAKCIDDLSCPEGYGCDPFGVCRLIPAV